MPRQAPKVIAGMREGRDTRMESMQEIERLESNPELPQVVAGLDPKKGTIYISKYPSYRVQITSPGDVINPVTGQRSKARAIVAVFKNGRYQADAKDKATRKLIDDTLQSNSRFGKPGKGDFWLLSDQEAAIKEAGLKKARATLETLPKEEVIAFVESLQKKSGAADHELAPPTA